MLRKRYGILSKDGSQRDLPVLPREHPLAARFAATALRRSRTLLDAGAYDPDAIAKQVRKANLVLYGKPAPTEAEKQRARGMRLEKDVAYHFGEAQQPFDHLRKSANGWIETTEVADDDPEMPESTREALRSVRESGRPEVRAYKSHAVMPLREVKRAEDGSVPVMAIRMGDGNPGDKNYYAESFVDSVVQLLPGTDAFYNHASLSQEKDLPERDVREKCGWFSEPWKAPFQDPRQIGAPVVPAAWATFHPRDGDPVVESLLRTCANKFRKYPEKDPFAAFSINAYGIGSPGEHPETGEFRNVMERATNLMSVDMVTAAGAAGRPDFSFQESDTMPKTLGKKDATKVVRLSAHTIDPHLGVDIRTDAEKEADAASLVTEALRAAVADLFAGPQGKMLREAAGAAADLDVLDTAKISNADFLKLADKLGLKSTGNVTQVLKKNTVVDEQTGVTGSTETLEDHEEGEGVEESAEGEAQGEEIEESLTAAQVAALTPAQMRAKLLAIAKKPNKESAVSPEITARLADLDKRERALVAREAAVKQSKFSAVVSEVCERFKIPEGAHRNRLARECSGAKSNDEIVEIARDYVQINLRDIEPSGNGGGTRSRESSSGSKFTPTFMR